MLFIRDFFGTVQANIYEGDLVLDIYALPQCLLDAFLKLFLTLSFLSNCSTATFCLSPSFSLTVSDNGAPSAK